MEAAESERGRSEGGDFELWAEETVDIETPFSSKTQDDVDYLKLEVAELKQILISLAEKYKLSEDRRKVAERRNSFLKADNMRLQQASDSAIGQKIEAEIENRRTLDKLREFVDFKVEFEKQAELLKKIISHLPKMKNAGTTTRTQSFEKALQCSGDGTAQDVDVDEYHLPMDDDLENSVIDCTGDSKKSAVTDETIYSEAVEMVSPSTPRSDLEKGTEDYQTSREAVEKIRDSTSISSRRDGSAESREHTGNQVRLWGPRPNKKPQSLSTSDVKSEKGKGNVVKLKQEVLALKNLNEWKSTDLDYKNRQLVVKNRELLSAKKEITQLKMRVNSLLVEQQKRPLKTCTSLSPAKFDREATDQQPLKENTRYRDAKFKTEEMAKRHTDNDKRNLPASKDNVWREIAPGDQVRIKIHRHN